MCPFGTFLNGTECDSCGAMCGTCDSVSCSVCINNETMSVSLDHCECNTGYYTDNGNCTKCGHLCASCDSADHCETCMDPHTMEVSTDPGSCTCKERSYENEGECISCGYACEDCDSSGCLTCNFTNMIKDGDNCTCDDG